MGGGYQGIYLRPQLQVYQKHPLSYISLSELRLDLESLLGFRRLNFHHHWVHLVTIKIHSSILSVSSKSADMLLLGQARNVCLGQYFWHEESTHSSWASARTCFPSLVWFPVTEKLFPLPQPPLQDPPAGPSMSFQPGLLISNSKIEGGSQMFHSGLLYLFI